MKYVLIVNNCSKGIVYSCSQTHTQNVHIWKQGSWYVIYKITHFQSAKQRFVYYWSSELPVRHWKWHLSQIDGCDPHSWMQKLPCLLSFYDELSLFTTEQFFNLDCKYWKTNFLFRTGNWPKLFFVFIFIPSLNKLYETAQNQSIVIIIKVLNK